MTGFDLLDPLTYLRMAAKAKVSEPEKGKTFSPRKHPGTHYTFICALKDSDCDIDAFGALGVAYPDDGTVHIDLWLDGDGRPTYLKVGSTMADNEASNERPSLLKVTARISLSAFGSSVTIKAPRAGQVG